VPHEIALTDRRVAQIVRRMQDLPGQELFQYVDEDGGTRAVESADVNAYLKSVSGEEFTSKDFRTWAGTLLCTRALRRLPPPQSAAAGKREVAQAIDAVARELRNTRAVCRKCYVHPAVIETYLGGHLQHALRGLSEQAALISLLQGRTKPARGRSRPARRLLQQITIPARSKPCAASSAASRQSSP